MTNSFSFTLEINGEEFDAECEFDYIPGERQTRDHPGCDEEFTPNELFLIYKDKKYSLRHIIEPLLDVITDAFNGWKEEQ